MIALPGAVAALASSEVPRPGAVVAVTPARLSDSRPEGVTVDDIGAATGRLTAGATLRIPTLGREGLPAAGVGGVVVNVTVVVPPTGVAGFATVFGCGERPLASSVNWTSPGSVVARGVVVEVSAAGDLCVFVSSGADVVVDATGWIVAAGAAGRIDPGGLGLVRPGRLADTRPGSGTVDGVGRGTGRVPAGGLLEVPVLGRAGVPDGGVAGVAVSAVAVDPAAAGHLTLFPCGEPVPLASTLNYVAGDVVSNTQLVPLGAGGAVCVSAFAATDVVLDVTAWVAAAPDVREAGGVEMVSPARVLDTRGGSTIDGGNSVGRLADGDVVEVALEGRAGLAADGLTAVALSVIAVGPDVHGYLALYPCGQRPLASTVNFAPQAVVANSAIVSLAAAGSVCVFARGSVDVVIDVTAGVNGPAPDLLAPTDDDWAADGGVAPVVVAGQAVDASAPEGFDVQGDGFVDDVPATIGVDAPELTLPGGGRWETRLRADPRAFADGTVMLAAGGPDDVGRRVVLEVLDPDELAAVGLQGLAVSVAPVDGQGDVAVALTLDYGGFRGLFGGDWEERLRLAVGSGCVWDTSLPGFAATEPGCTTELAAVAAGHDLTVGVVSATVVFAESAHLTGPAGAGAASGLAGAVMAGNTGSGGTIAGLLAALGGSSGSFAGSPVAANGSWSQGGGSGGFGWSYPFTLPDVGRGGPAPAFGLSYNSQAVDAMTSNTTSQASAVGLGWSLAGDAFVERSYAPCTAVGGGTGDLCWDGWQVSLVLDGVSSRLVPIETAPGSEYTEWRLEADNGWRVIRHTDGPTSGEPGLFDADGEWWELVAPDGTLYRFGHGVHPGTVTQSLWAVPVRGIHAGDPCYSAPDRMCEQGWRWMLDQVVDPVGVSQVRAYRTETNHYAALGRPNQPQAYTRGGLIDRVWWGIAPGAGVAAASHRMEFVSSWRCHTLRTTCGEPASASGHLFPEVPTDLMCASTGPCTNWSPAFFTALRLHTVNTFSLGQPVDRWELAHEVVGAELPRMWLRSVQRVEPTPHGSVGVRLPAVRFESFGSRLANRWDADPAAGVSAMALHRVDTIRDELGGQTVVTYGQPSGCAGQPAQGWHHNAQNCFPDVWTPTGGSPGWGVFNVYVVTAVSHGTIAPDATFGDRDAWAGTPSTTTYQYEGDDQGYMDGGGWRHAQRRGTAFKTQSWSVWRGYPRVVATTAAHPGATGDDVTRTESYYFRGLDGNRLAGGGAQQVNVRAASLEPGPTDTAVADADWLAGRLLSVRVTNGDQVVESLTVTIPGGLVETPSLALGGHVTGGFVEEALTARRYDTVDVWTSTGGTALTHTHTDLNADGLPASVVEFGDVDDGADDRCTTTTYEIHGNVRDRPGRVATHNGATCQPASLVTATEFDWDDQGRVVREYVGANEALGTVWEAAYDGSWGRVSLITDPNNRDTHITYASITGGERTTIEDAAGQLTVREVDRRGNTTRTVDPHGHVAGAGYDLFGRLTSSWDPTSSATAPMQRVTYGLFVNNANPAAPYLGNYEHRGVVVATERLTGTAGEYTRTTSYLDGLGRTVETHTTNHAGGHLAAGSVYDGRGDLVREIAAFDAPGSVGDGTASTGARVPVDAAARPLETRNRFDASGRPIRTAVWADGAETQITTITYAGFVTVVDPPGATDSVTTTVDGLGRTVETNPAGGSVHTSSFDAADRLQVQAVGTHVSEFDHDAAGRLIEERDPNRGRTWFEYDPAGNLTRRHDAAGNMVRTVYDELNRPTARYATAPADGVEHLVAEWAYTDDGRLSEAVSYSDDHRYEIFTSGYDPADRPRQTRYRVTSADGAVELADYTEQTDGFTPGGAPTAVTYGDLGPLPAETLSHTYTANGLPATTTITPADGEPAQLAVTGYDRLDRAETRTLGDGIDQVTRTYGYDSQRRLSSLAATLAEGTPVQHDDYRFDPAGNVTSIDHRVVAGGAAGDAHRECFVHDERAHLDRAYTTGVDSACGPGAGADLDAGPAGVGYDSEWDQSASGSISSADHVTATLDQHFNYGYGSDNGRPDAPSQLTITDNTAGSEATAGIGYTAYGARSGSVPVPTEVGWLDPFPVPERLYDSRDPADPDLAPGGEVVIDLADVVPAIANVDEITAVMVNVAMVNTVDRGSLTLWPDTGAARPLVEYITTDGPAPVENLAVVAVEGGRFRLAASETSLDAFVDLIAVYRHTDVEVSAGRVIPVTPYRAYDSRSDDNGQLNGQGDGPMLANEYRTISVAGPQLPPGNQAAAVIVTFTVDEIDMSGYFTVLPDGWVAAVDGCDNDANPATPNVPCTSTLNAAPNEARANQVAVMVSLNALREFQVYSRSGGQVVVDVVAYVTGPGAGLDDYGLYGQLPGPHEVASVTTSAQDPFFPVPVAGAGGVPLDAIAVTGIVGLSNGQPAHATVYPADSPADPVPVTSSVNAPAGQIRAAHFTTGLDNGHLGVSSPFPVTVAVTVTGFYRADLPDPDAEPLELEPAQLGYDAQQQLTSTATHAGEVTRYDYWPDGTRAAVHHPDNTTVLYLGASEATWDRASEAIVSATRSYTHAGAAVAVRADAGDLTWLLGDRQGSITTSISAGGAQVHYYTPYGQPRTPDPDGTTRGWLNQHHDPTGLNYLNNRYYDPILGVFTSVDLLVRSTREPYAYGSSNPVTLSDPTGLDPDTNAQIRATAMSKGYCTYSAAKSASNVCGPRNGRFYGKLNSSGASGLDAFTTGDLRTLVAQAVSAAFSPRTISAPPNPSLGPNAISQDYVAAGPGYSDSESAGAVARLLTPSILTRLLDWISAPQAVNQNWPEEFDQLAATRLLAWSGPHQVDACGTAATRATVFCVASQRLPSGDPDADAVTYGHFVFYDINESGAVVNPDGTYSIKTNYLAHEMVHVAQYEIFGDAFFEHYAVGSSSLEDEAYLVGP